MVKVSTVFEGLGIQHNRELRLEDLNDRLIGDLLGAANDYLAAGKPFNAAVVAVILEGRRRLKKVAP